MSAEIKELASLKMRHIQSEIDANKNPEIEFAELVDLYFSNGRPAFFAEFKEDMLSAFPTVLQTFKTEMMFYVTHRLFLFVRTVKTELTDRQNQDEIELRVFQPFYKRLKEWLPNIKAQKLNFEPQKNTYMVVTRHAVTQGMYAPGKYIYSVCRALLNAKKQVVLVNLGDTDRAFKSLNSYSNYTAFDGSDEPAKLFYGLRKLIQDFRPAEVLTEIELSSLNLIEAIGVSSKICLLSAGVFKTPWFHKKYLPTEIYHEEDKLDASLVPIPQTHSEEILAPRCDPHVLDALRRKYALEGKFVIGSFARYEKFSLDFLKLAKGALNSIPNSVLILAGSNEQSFATDFFSEEISQNKVILLGPVKTYVVGWVVDVFLDTFPQICGFSALESLAKGKPVFTYKGSDIGLYVKSRDPNLVFEDKTELIQYLRTIALSARKYKVLSARSVEIAETYYDDSALSRSITSSY